MPIQGAASPTRRTFAQTAMAGLAGYSSVTGRRAGAAEIAPDGLRIRGVVMVPETLTLEDWPDRARRRA